MSEELDDASYTVRDSRNPGWFWMENAALDRIKKLEDRSCRHKALRVYTELCRQASAQRTQDRVKLKYTELADLCDMGKATVIEAIHILTEGLYNERWSVKGLNLIRKEVDNDSKGQHPNVYFLLSAVHRVDSSKKKQSTENDKEVHDGGPVSILEKNLKKPPVPVPPKGMTKQELQGALALHYPKFDPRHPGYRTLPRAEKAKLLEAWETTSQRTYTPVSDFDIQKYLKEHPRG